MGAFGKIILVAVTLYVVWLGYSVHQKLQPPTLPPPLPETWWGPGEAKPVDTSIRKFKINVSDKVLDDLRQRLNNVPIFTPPLENTQFEYGFNTDTLLKVLDFWKNNYNWRDREVYLNKYPQFKTNIQGLDLHFIHVKPNVPKNVRVLPLLLLHGWPGSVREFYEFLPFITEPRKDADFVFEVIAPSLPGYGFSQGASKAGLGAAQMAVVMKNLMLRVGHKRFYIQGGDWGAGIAAIMATMFKENVIGIHSNMCVVNSPASTLWMILGQFMPSLIVDKKYEDRMYPLSEQFKFIMREFGYMHIQATKPDTVGVALRDSPAGLAAYILEKFSTWTDNNWIREKDGGLHKKWTMVELLDNVMIYWVTNSITTSMRLYSESFSIAHLSLDIDGVPNNVPTACARFKNEFLYTPDSLLKLRFLNLVQTTDLPDGGHFAAFEQPQLLADDFISAVKKIEQFYNSKQTQQK